MCEMCSLNVKFKSFENAWLMDEEDRVCFSKAEDENGISHFIEHMFFKGTNKRTAKDIVQEIENIGGQINAFTSKETTCYYLKSLNTQVDLCLDVLSDMLLNSKFDEEEIAKEQGVVIEEIKADAGIDIGFTLIGMHLKKVAVPVRLENNRIGEATVIAARSRPKFIGGERAIYNEELM